MLGASMVGCSSPAGASLQESRAQELVRELEDLGLAAFHGDDWRQAAASAAKGDLLQQHLRFEPHSGQGSFPLLMPAESELLSLGDAALGYVQAALLRDKMADTIRERFVRLLGLLRSPTSVPCLVDTSWNSESPEVRREAISALGCIGGDPAKRTLREHEARGSASGFLRASIWIALSRCGDAEARAKAMAWLEMTVADPHQDGSSPLLHVLRDAAELPGRDTQRVFIEGLRSPCDVVRHFSYLRLKPLVDADAWQRLPAVECLARGAPHEETTYNEWMRWWANR
jgi:HEAT repeat protein